MRPRGVREIQCAKRLKGKAKHHVELLPTLAQRKPRRAWSGISIRTANPSSNRGSQETMLIVRRATEADLGAIVQSWGELMDFHGRLDPFFRVSNGATEAYRAFARQNLRKRQTLLLVAEVNGIVVGHALGEAVKYPPIYPRSRYAEIIEIAVTPSYRRQGIGSRLLQALTEHFRSEGICHFEAGVVTANSLARRFWEKAGFRGVMTRYHREET
jgi:ribosomal protein S18 acetylase RimI-like enzyme